VEESNTLKIKKKVHVKKIYMIINYDKYYEDKIQGDLLGGCFHWTLGTLK
jgi:hypothetical protein